MKKLTIFVALAVCSTGCTALRLQRGVINQTTTLTELQYKQVLTNLARIHDDRSALPSQVSIRDGSAQIQDSGSVTGTLFLDKANGLPPSITGTRVVVEQWSVVPVTDDTCLRLLRFAYMRAMDGTTSLLTEPGFANDLAHELKKQIPWPENPYIVSGGLGGMQGSLPGGGGVQIDKSTASSNEAKSDPGIMLSQDTPNLDVFTNGISEIINPTPAGIYKKSVKQTELSFAAARAVNDVIEQNSISTSSESILDDEELINLDSFKPSVYKDGTKYVTQSAKEVRRQVKQVQDDMLKINGGWVHFGDHKPKNACHYARYGNTYAWVCEDGLADLANFTLTTLSFSGLIKDSSIITTPGGPRFTPSPGR